MRTLLSLTQKILLIIMVFCITDAYAGIDNISGAYVASTMVGNIFCIEIIQQDEKIEGKFDEVDFQQVVPIERGYYKDDRLHFSVHFKINKRPIHLEMDASILKEDPIIFHGNYNIGKEKGMFILYSVKIKPPICRRLYLKH